MYTEGQAICNTFTSANYLSFLHKSERLVSLLMQGMFTLPLPIRIFFICQFHYLGITLSFCTLIFDFIGNLHIHIAYSNPIYLLCLNTSFVFTNYQPRQCNAYYNRAIIFDWSLSGIIIPKLVIKESESPEPAGSPCMS